jgi:hypothetical protein
MIPFDAQIRQTALPQSTQRRCRTDSGECIGHGNEAGEPATWIADKISR